MPNFNDLSLAFPLLSSKYNTAALSTTTASQGQLSGAAVVVMNNSGANPGTYTTRTATQMIADDNLQVGQIYVVILTNGQGTGTLTLAGGTGVTITGTATATINVGRIYTVTVTSASALTFQNVGSFTAP